MQPVPVHFSAHSDRPLGGRYFKAAQDQLSDTDPDLKALKDLSDKILERMQGIDDKYAQLKQEYKTAIEAAEENGDQSQVKELKSGQANFANEIKQASSSCLQAYKEGQQRLDTVMEQVRDVFTDVAKKYN